MFSANYLAIIGKTDPFTPSVPNAIPLRTGIPWADLPEQYGPPTTVYNRFNRWSCAGHWDRIMEAIADADNVDTVMIDGTSVRAHHSATTLKKRPTPLFRSLTGRIRDENTCTYQSGRATDPI